MISHETRISGTNDHFKYISGISLFHVYDNDSSGYIGYFNSARAFEHIGNGKAKNFSAYGEVEFSIDENWSATVGGRLDYTKSERRIFFSMNSHLIIPEAKNSRATMQALPSLAISWRPSQKMIAFARYQRGFRPGGFGLAIEGGKLKLAATPADRASSSQIGIRYGATSEDAFSANLVLSRTRWVDIQSDMPNLLGVSSPFYGGDATIVGFEAAVTARPVKDLTFQGAVFWNDIERSNRDWSNSLPNIPRLGVPHLLHISLPHFAALN